MKEIRICWLPDLPIRKDDPSPNCSAWMKDDAENRRQVQTMLDLALRVYGPASHWIEEREG